ncbi:MAG: T9SS type A sorting domain-containing protein [Ignavibacteria bacterium]|nr:T9SS type A sorting domain-containing protein [Ignavibacteria bacterium]
MGNSEFYFLGFGVYYLQWMAADSSTRYIVEDVFKVAKQLGIKVIRTWGFNSSSDSTKPSTIRYKPYELKEDGLKALDYVIYKAKQYEVNLVLTLENNFSDFGGINQYIDWANNLLTPKTGKVYEHNDFFTDDSIKNWYKYYVNTILNRRNIYTTESYKDEPIIFSFELINEAANTGFDVNIVNGWYKEMADYFKSIDGNHLLTTGEIGYDIHRDYYSDWDFFYNSSQFLFNGQKGTSFVENTSLEKIDYSSFHLYPDAWGFEPLAGNTWINDHIDITNNFNKPALLGEFGLVNEKLKNYKIYFETIRNTLTKSTIIWNYLHPDLMHIADKFAFNEVQNPELIELFKEHIQLLDKDSVKTNEVQYILYQNYPNPFNPTTTIQYTLMKTEYVKMELFNSLGELIRVVEEGVKEAGTYKLYLSFNNLLLTSGIYFYRIRAGDFVETKKMILLK